MSARTNFAILDRNIGLLQWIGAADTAAAALSAFDADVGLGEYGDEEHWAIYHVTAAEAEQITRWAANGSAGGERPAALA